MLRTVTLSLLIFVSVGVMIPIASSTHGLRQNSVSQHRRYRRHSRAWWRRYRARLRARRAAALARRQAAVRSDAAHPAAPLALSVSRDARTEPMSGVIPKLPVGWTSAVANNGEVKFKTG